MMLGNATVNPLRVGQSKQLADEACKPGLYTALWVAGSKVPALDAPELR